MVTPVMGSSTKVNFVMENTTGEWLCLLLWSCDLSVPFSNGMWLKCHWQMKGSEPVPTKFGKIRQYTGQWKAGLMDGFGVGR